MKSIAITEQDRRIGAALAFLRTRDCNQTQTVFARRFGISRSHLSKIESGIKPLSAKLGWIICRTLNADPRWLCHAGNSDRENVFPLTDPAEIEKFEKHFFARKNGMMRAVWSKVDWQIEEAERKYMLTDSSSSGKIAEVKAQLPNLLDRLNRATKPSGMMTALAEYLAKATGETVPLASVSRWLAGKRMPGGEITLLMLKWVEQQERQLNAGPKNEL